MDSLEAIFTAQADLQKRVYGKDLTELTTQERIEAFRLHHLALENELHEALGEMSWKPWQSAEYFDKPRVHGELVDALHFLVNLILISGGNAASTYEGYKAKRDVNEKRQADGYDGVTGKDPITKRAMDEPIVEGMN